MKLTSIARSIGIICTCSALCLCNIPLVHAGTITINDANSPVDYVIPPPGSPNIVNILEGAVVGAGLSLPEGITLGVIGHDLSERVTGNTINVSGGSISGDVVGGSYLGNITGSNNVNISGGAIGGNIYGIHTVDGHISESTGVHVSGGTVGGGVYGAYTDAGNVTSNAIAIEDDPAITGGTTINSVYGGYTALGNAISNVINTSSGTVGDAYSGYSELGDVWDNVFNFNGGTVNNIAAGYTVLGESWGNQVNLTGETGTVNGNVSAGYSVSAGGVARDNTVVIDFGGTSNGMISGGRSDFGDTTDNEVLLVNGNVNGITGGYASHGRTTGNTVAITGGFAQSVYGGYTVDGIVENNTVLIDGTEATVGTAAGGFNDLGNVFNNHVEIENVNGITSIYGGQANQGDAKDNTITVEAGTFTGGSLVGGGSMVSGNAMNNQVTINGGSGVISNVYGGRAVDGDADGNEISIINTSLNITTAIGGGSAEGMARENVVTVQGGRIGSAYGGTSGFGDAALNHVTIINSTLTGGTVAGGASSESGDAIDNETAIRDNSSGNASNIYGGWTQLGNATTNRVIIESGTVGANTVAGGYSNSGSARNNIVTINSSGSFANIYGGYAGGGDATGNTLELANGRYSGTIAGGFSVSGAATGNTVTIYENATLNVGVLLYGGFSGSGYDSRTGNTLNLRKPVALKGLDNFESYNFVLPPNFTANDTFVSVTAGNGEGGPIHLSDSQVIVGMEIPNTNLKEGDIIVLIDEKGGFGFDGNPANSTSNGASVGLLDYEFDLAVVENQLLANITDVQGSPTTTSLSEGFVSGLILANLGADAIAGPAMDSAMASVHGSAKTGFGGFGSFVAEKSRYKTGSHVDMLGISAAAGLAYGINYDERYITLGPFLEYGNGNYDTFSQISGQEIRGDGESEYMGGGFLFRWDEKSVGKGRYTAEASVRVGRLTNSFSSSDLLSSSEQPIEFDSSARHYGMHFGYGGSWGLSNATGLDIYGKYFWARGDSNSVSLSTGEPIEFDNVSSHRLRGGARFSFNPGQRTTLYVGGAYEHQLDGWVEANVYSYAIDAPALSGGTGIGEFVMSYRPSASGQTSINVGIQGFGGKRQGVAGNLFVRF